MIENGVENGKIVKGKIMANSNSISEARSRVLAAEDERVAGSELERLEQVVKWLDDLIRIPILNIRIGLDPILGAIPWLGDTATAVFSMYLIGSALYYQVPKVVILRMALNVGFDYLMGIVPFVGDAADFFIKSNRWNLNLLRQHARTRRKPGFSDYLFVGGVIGGLILLVVGGIALTIYFLSSAGKLW
jgi:hypothetical protein